MEGSDDRDKAYKCLGNGLYSLPIDELSGKYNFPKCIPRRKQNLFYFVHDPLMVLGAGQIQLKTTQLIWCKPNHK